MKRTATILGAVFALALALPTVANAANFAGTWAVSGILGHPVTATASPVCVFRQSRNAISGTCKGPNGIGSALGAVNGSAIEWQWHIIATDPQGLSGIATFRGVLDADGVIRGTWHHSDNPAIIGTFTAQRVR